MTDKWNNLVVTTGTGYLLTTCLLSRSMPWADIFLAASVLLECLLLCVWTKRSDSALKQDFKFRPKCSSGVIFVLFVPLALLAESRTGVALKFSQDLTNPFEKVWLSMSFSITIVAKYFSKAQLSHGLVGILLILGFAVPWLSSPPVQALYMGLCNAMVWKGMDLIPSVLPKSFTYGELAVVLQLIVNWGCRLVSGISEVYTLDDDDFKLTCFICTVVISISTATLVVCLSGYYTSLLGTSAIYIGHAVIALVFLHIQIREEPLLWLIGYVFSSCPRIILLVICLLLLAFAVVWTAIESLSSQAQLSQPKSDSNLDSSEDTAAHRAEDDTIGDASRLDQRGLGSAKHQLPGAVVRRKNSFETRKIFHVFILLVYVPGLLLDAGFLLLASTCAFGLFVILEAVRALQVPIIGKLLDEIQRPFVDERDQGPVFLTHIYLLAGLSLPLWMSQNILSGGQAPLELYSGVLALGVGDTVACVAGRAFGRIHWPGSKKTVEGTTSSVLAQLVFIAVASSFGFLTVKSYTSGGVGILLSALVEAFTDQIDNLILPLVLYPFLCL